MKVYGEFEINDIFKITNQGIILVGKIISENKAIMISKGDKICFDYGNKELKRNIKGHERGFGRNIAIELNHHQNVAILIECADDDEIEDLNNWKPNKIIGKLISKPFGSSEK